MPRSREEIAELAMKFFDRLEEEHPNCVVEDALLLVELADPEDLNHRGEPATLVLGECTSNRITVQAGIVKLADEAMHFEEDDDD